MGTGLTLLADDVTPKARTMYLYRTNAKREPLGRHLLKTTDPLDREAIRSQFGPGWFYCMETGGVDEDGKPLPLATGAIYVEGADPSKVDRLPVEDLVNNPSDFYREMQEIYKLRALEREARGEPNFLEMFKVMKDLLQRPPTEGSDVLNAFLRGAEWGSPEPPAAAMSDPLTDAITKLVESRAAGGDPRAARLAALLQRKVKILEDRIQTLEGEKTSLEVRARNAEAVERPGPIEVDEFEETMIEAVRHVAGSGARDLTQALVEISGSAPNLIEEILSLGAETRADLIGRALGASFPDLVEAYTDSLEVYLGRIQESRSPALPAALRRDETPERRPSPAPPPKTAGKRK